MKRAIAMVFSLLLVQCGTKAATQSKPKEPQAVDAPKVTYVTWIEVGDGEQFWSTIKQNDKNVALIGTEVCPPCHVAKDWWESKISPPGWQFVYWQLGPSDDLLTKSFKEIFKNLQAQNNLSLPYLSIIEDAHDPKKIKEITATFRDLEGCTSEANKFLIMHPQGTIHF
ncbi:MAG: hypothetical protein P1P90_05290 [Patescibacteria group bacterium]|nr:hypothetical protein [Patescibacteria group bacterium]